MVVCMCVNGSAQGMLSYVCVCVYVCVYICELVRRKDRLHFFTVPSNRHIHIYIHIYIHTYTHTHLKNRQPVQILLG